MEGLYNLNRENTLEQPASDNDSFLPCNRLKTKLSDYEVKLEHNESSYRGKMSEDQDNIDNCRSYEETDSKITVKQVGAKFDETDQKKYLMRTTSWSMDSPKPVPLDFCGTNNRQRVAFIVKEFELSRLRNFEREVSSLKKLSALPNDRDNISAPKLFATCKSKQYYAIIMEYVPGKTLKKVLEDFKGKMPEHVVRSIVKAFMDYLKWLNSVRVMHLDIKPDNVIVRFNCKTLGVKISVSCQSEESQSTSTSSSTNDQSAASNESYDIDYNRELKLCFIDYDLSVSFDDLLDEKKYPYYAGGTPIYASPNMIYRWLKVLNDKSNCPKDKDLSHDVPLDPKMDFHSVAFILHEFRYETPFFAELEEQKKK